MTSMVFFRLFFIVLLAAHKAIADPEVRGCSQGSQGNPTINEGDFIECQERAIDFLCLIHHGEVSCSEMKPLVENCFKNKCYPSLEKICRDPNSDWSDLATSYQPYVKFECTANSVGVWPSCCKDAAQKSCDAFINMTGDGKFTCSKF